MRWLAFLSFFLLTASVVSAKPMASPDLASGVAQSDRVVVAEYLDYEGQDPEYFTGPIAAYKVVRVLKGEPSKSLRVRYAFHDGSACLAPPNWQFSASHMPKPNSRWILLLQGDNTYRGDFGRLPYSQENLKKIESHL